MDEIVETSFPFPIADTESGPDILYTDYEVELKFTDYTKIPRKILFHEVPFFAFKSTDADSRELLDDRTYIIKNSSIIKNLMETNEISNPSEFTHQIICFNEVGSFLEIVYSKMEY